MAPPMILKDELVFLAKLGLTVTAFGKDLEKSYRGSRESNIFFVVTRSGGDELCYPDTLPEGDMDKLRKWIRCGDQTGLSPEWREINFAGFKIKAYLAGENPGIDCTSVMDEMFANEGGKNHTYALSTKTKLAVRITHPQDHLNLKENYRKPWKTAKHFSDLIALNRKFLSGQISETPYHLGEIDEETIPLVHGLLKLHDFGLFTINSQPYYHEKSKSDNKWTECQQRPYVSFIMPGKDVPYMDFFKRLKERADIVVSAEELCPFTIVNGSHDPHDVTRERNSDTEKDLEDAEWKTYTGVCSGEDMSELVLDALAVMKLVKPVCFDVAAREWGIQLDLLRVIEEVAIGCGLPRIYAA